MKTILCYGDSNTWGDDPDGGPRFGHDIRWPRILQNKLGSGYYVIEEGLCGRTTDLDDKSSHKRNGLSYLPACVSSHDPINFFLIMLGTNDLKDRFGREVRDIAEAIGRLIEVIRKETDSPNMLILSPALVNSQASRFYIYSHDLSMAEKKSERFAVEFEKVAKLHQCLFLDTAPIARTGSDGVHLSKESHLALAKAIAEIVH